MKKVFLDDLPRRGKLIDWKSSVGHKVKFVYDDIEGEVEIVEYVIKNNKTYIKIKYENKLSDYIFSSHFSRCTLGELLEKRTKEYKYEVGDVIYDVKSGILEIIELVRVEQVKGYKYKCKKCGNIDIVSENHLKSRCGCNVCCIPSQKTLVGYNDIHTTEPEFGKLIWRYDDGHEFTCNSNLKVDFRCQNCGEKINSKQISSMYNKHFKLNKSLPCPSCSDGISYPNKFMYNVLKQIKEHSKNIVFKTEYSPKYAVVKGHQSKKLNGKKYYDFFVKTIIESEGKKKIVSFIIEVQGSQHSEERRKVTRKLEEEQENDRLKQLLCAKNSQCRYIAVDAKLSELEYIKQSILNSEISKLIDLSVVDWNKAHEDSQSSLVKKAWDYWNSGDYSVLEISKLIDVSKGTVIRYLNRGAELEKCVYNGKEEISKASKLNGKPVVRLTLNGVYIDEFVSASEAYRKLSILHPNISSVCRGKVQTAGGFKWMFKEDYEKYIAIQAAQ